MASRRLRSVPVAWCLTALPLGAATAARPAQAAATRHPSILWIVAEDMGRDLGSYGALDARTPHLDRLAGEGVRFTNFFGVAPVCAPNRSSLATGMFATTVGSHHMRSQVVPLPHVRLVSEYLRARGYYTTNNAKTDYTSPPSRRRRRSRPGTSPALARTGATGPPASRSSRSSRCS